jgi:hypothetical protein
MYLYKVGSNDAEGEKMHQFYHEEKYTDRQLQKILAEVLVELVGKEAHNSALMGCEFYSEDFVKKMKKRGFKPVKYQATSVISGFMNFFDKEERDDWGDGVLSKMIEGKLWRIEIKEGEWSKKYYAIADTEAEARNKFFQPVLWSIMSPGESEAEYAARKKARKMVKDIKIEDVH